MERSKPLSGLHGTPGMWNSTWLVVNQPTWWQLYKKITVLDLNIHEHQMLRVHVPVLPSTWDYQNLPEAPADTKAFRSLLTGMEGRGR